MHELQITQATAMPQNCVMTLKDVVDIINEKRGVKSGDKGFIQHVTALRNIKKLSETTSFGLVNKWLSHNIDKLGRRKEVETLALTKKQAIAVGAKLDNEMLMAVIDKIEELENKNANQALALPNFEDPIAAAEAWILAKKTEQQALIA